MAFLLRSSQVELVRAAVRARLGPRAAGVTLRYHPFPARLRVDVARPRAWQGLGLVLGAAPSTHRHAPLSLRLSRLYQATVADATLLAAWLDEEAEAALVEAPVASLSCDGDLLRVCLFTHVELARLVDGVVATLALAGASSRLAARWRVAADACGLELATAPADDEPELTAACPDAHGVVDGRRVLVGVRRRRGVSRLVVSRDHDGAPPDPALVPEGAVLSCTPIASVLTFTGVPVGAAPWHRALRALVGDGQRAAAYR